MVSHSQYSFSLSRPGLKSGHRVKPRLRLVDTVTVAFSVIAAFGGIFLWFKCLQWDSRLGLGIIVPNHFTFFPFLIVLMGLCVYTSYFVTRYALEVVFRCAGLLLAEEARHFPLQFSKNSCQAWPESWQEPQPKRTEL